MRNLLTKTTLLLLGAFACLSISCAGPRTYQAPSVAATRASVTRAQSSVSDAQTHVVKAVKIAREAQVKITQLVEDKTLTPELHDLAVAANADVDLLQKELTDTQESLANAQKSLADSQANVATLQKDIKKQTDTLNKTAADLSKTKHSYHVLKFAVIGLAMAVTAFVIFSVFSFAAFAPPLLYVLIGAPVAVGAFLLFRL